MKPTRPHGRKYRSLEGVPRIPDLFAAACGVGDLPYVFDGDVELSRRQVAHQARAFQRMLLDTGVRKDDVVLLQLPNWWQTVAMAHAVWGLGAIVNPVTTIYRSADLATIISLARPRAIAVPAMFRGVDHVALAREALRVSGHDAPVISVDHDALDRTADDLLEVSTGDPDDVAMLMYTSGTTGRPKGVLHSHRTLLVESQSIADAFHLRGKRVFMPSPLTHITGLLYGVLMPLQIDEGVVLLDRWEPEVAHELVIRRDCRATVAATPFLSGLTEVSEARRERSTLEVFVCGGADIPGHLVRRAESVMGTQVSRTYGSTELPTLCTVPPTERSDARYTTEGPPIGEARARLAQAEAGIGELEVHGPEMFVGYLDDQDNDSSFTDDGWFRTGDLARMDEKGRIAIVGRIKDLIIRGGENISAKEVEEHLLQHEAVLDCAVVGVSHDVMGETVCAVVVAREGTTPTLETLTSHLAELDIARQKWPESLVICDELPRTTSGKIQKFRVREYAAEQIRTGAADVRNKEG